MITNLRHFAICVIDIDKAINFYSDLGGKLTSQDFERGKFIESLLGLNHVQVKTCKMVFKDNSRLELMQFINPTVKEQDLEPQTQDMQVAIVLPGFHHIAFTVTNLEKTVRKVISHGGIPLGEPAIPDKNHSIHAVSAKHIYMRDPFGNLLHLAQDIE